MSESLVLVVDDDSLGRLSAVLLLDEAGFDTLEASGADAAIALLEARRDIKVVFADINMPGGMNGLELAQIIRHRWPPVGLVLTSGHRRVRGEDMPERGHYLGKPYSPAQLVGVIWSLVH